MRTRAGFFVWVALLALAFAGVASAQRTGGSFGGSRWSSPPSASYRASPPPSPPPSSFRSGSSPPPSSGRSSRAEYRNESGSSAGSSASTEAPDPAATAEDSAFLRWILSGLFVCFVLFGLWLIRGFLSLVGVFDWFADWRRHRAHRRQREHRPAASPAPAPPVAAPRPAAAPPCELRRVSVAFDWRERPELQRALAKLAGTVDPSSAAGLFAAADRARGLMRGALHSARYAVCQSLLLTHAEAHARFDDTVAKLRARYEMETVRNAERRAAEGLVADREEGSGMLVVTLLVAVRENLPALPGTIAQDKLTDVLSNSLPDDPDALLAMELLWSPSEELDRLSSAELEALYPELLRMDDGAVGRVACGFCQAIYAAELRGCPACGAESSAPSKAKEGEESHACRFCNAPLAGYATKCAQCGGRVGA